MKKFVACMLVPMFLAGSFTACTPTQVSSAKDVMAKVSFYSKLARSFISVAENQYKDNEKVRSALAATVASLATLEALVATVGSGLGEKIDEAALIAATTELIQKVFSLINAIEEARRLKSTV